uniref:RNA exonuclease 1 homolog-like domain-containing protein n=1 Tax=Denticeps clupeoides TaxID=299321 RepID=A0AAY3ZXQ6_9TELE
MLPSAALFSQLDCPLRQRGRCDRPFCQYRHGQDAAEPPPSAQGQSSKGEKDSCYLELERINKQIETVKCEVEKEQKKLSRYHTAQVDSVPTYSDKYQSKYSINKAGKDFNSKYVPSTTQVSGASTSTVGTETKSNLVNAQKKRVAHVAKFEGASSKPKAQVIIPYRGGASQLPSVLPRGQLCQRPASLVTAVEKLYQTANMNRKPPLSAPQAAPIKNACVKIIPTVQLAPNVHFILPEGTCAVPVTLLPGPVTLPQPPQLTPAKCAFVVFSNWLKLICRGIKPQFLHLQLLLQPLPIKRKAKVKPDVGAKVPHDVRQRYVNLFVEEFLKTSATVQEAFEKALVEEKVVYDRSINRLKYLSVAVNSLKRLKSQSSLPVKADKSVQRSKGKIALDSGALHGAGDSSLYESLKEHVLSEEMLKENSYPMKHPHKAGCAIQYGDVKKSGPDCKSKVSVLCVVMNLFISKTIVH